MYHLNLTSYSRLAQKGTLGASSELGYTRTAGEVATLVPRPGSISYVTTMS